MVEKHRGRGAVSNPSGRFEALRREAFDDGWEGDEDAPGAPRTEVLDERARTVIGYNSSPDIPFDRSVNPYRGCEHGCIYCFARPSHAYLGLSPGLDFETRLRAKSEAPEVLRRELRKKGYLPAPLALGVNTDSYQPIERERGLTRELLRVLWEFKHPVNIITKSNLVVRDLDILADMAACGLASVNLSVTTLRRDLARVMEPRAATPQKRLEAIAALSGAGVPTGVLVAPVIPALTDGCLEAVLEACRDAGAQSAGYTLLRLPLELKELFEEWLQTHFPERAQHVLNLMRDCRGGELYQADFATRMRGTGPVAQLLAQRFALHCKKLGLQRAEATLRTDLFVVPPERGDQLALF